MALGGMPTLAGAGPSADGPVAAQRDFRNLGVGCGRLGLWSYGGSLSGTLCCGLGCSRSPLLVASFTQGAHAVHLAHRRVTGPTLGQGLRKPGLESPRL